MTVLLIALLVASVGLGITTADWFIERRKKS